jgi:N-acetylneuraminic acid mutarotase
MFSFLSSAWLGQVVRSGRGSRRPCKPSLEVLEDRNLLSYWTTVAPMLTARGDLAGVAGSDGRIYAIGGDAGAGAINTVQAYTPGLDSWSTRASLNTPRTRFAATVGQDGRIYAIGGITTGGAVIGSVEAYSLANIWSFVTPMLTARRSLVAATGGDGRIYAIGGRDAANVVTNIVERYNTGTQTWTAVAPLNIGRSSAAGATGADGRIYVIGGNTGVGVGAASITDTVEVYNPSTNKWTFVASTPTKHEIMGAVLGPNGRIFVIGGNNADSFASVTNVVEAYNPDINTWTTVTPPMPTARQGLGAATGFDGKIYAFGGFNATGTPLATVEILRYLGGLFGGATAPANSPSLVPVDPISSTVITATPTVVPLQEVSNQGGVPGNGASDTTAVRDQTDVVFASGADTLSQNLADALFASSIG